MLGLSPARLRAYVKAGLLCPQRGQAGELRFSFQDLLLLRTAEGLVTERLPPRRVRDALRKLRQRVPTEQPLTGMQLDSNGADVVVRDGETSWRADSGQGFLTFERTAATIIDNEAIPIGSLQALATAASTTAHRPSNPNSRNAPDAPGTPSIDEAFRIFSGGQTIDPAAQPTADDFYQLGCSLEDGAPEAARVAYQNVLAIDPDHGDAHVNLGRLMHESGDLEFAEEHYRAALLLRPNDATAFFNLGVVLEDRGRPEAAVETYEAALRVDPAHADAHFNAARLHDMAGRYEAALRHLRAYRNLTNG
jgi:tetratricopeptide (TPR) repeat protein